MKTAYLDCSMGIAGDMTLAALLDAGVDASAVRAAIDSLNLEGVSLDIREVMKEGFRATHVRVTHPEQHAHRHLSDITKIIDSATALSDAQRELAHRIFRAVAEAEAQVHGSSIGRIHFHEVGAIDSIVDIVGAAVAFDLLGAEQIVCSPLPTGRGQVRIDHGICTVPTPGTAELLKGIPLVDVPVELELTTPTGAAIVKTLADRFGPLPAMTIEQIGYGAGTADVPGRANLLRLFVGEVAATPMTDVVMLLETNLDDVSPEVIAHTRHEALEQGALDVYTTAVQMKKDRPGVVLSLLCKPSDAEVMETLLFRETGTLGIRRHRIERSVRARQPHQVQTAWGPVEGKVAWRQGEAVSFAPEFEACAALAKKHGLPLRDVYRAADAAYLANPQSRPATDESMPVKHRHDHDHDHDDDHDQ